MRFLSVDLRSESSMLNKESVLWFCMCPDFGAGVKYSTFGLVLEMGTGSVPYVKPCFSYASSSIPSPAFRLPLLLKIDDCSTIFTDSSVISREVFEALGVSLETRKSKTLMGWFCAGGTAEGGVGAGGGAFTMATILSVSSSGASSMYALRGVFDVGSEILTDFLACFDGFSLYNAPWYF